MTAKNESLDTVIDLSVSLVDAACGARRAPESAEALWLPADCYVAARDAMGVARLSRAQKSAFHARVISKHIERNIRRFGIVAR